MKRVSPVLISGLCVLALPAVAACGATADSADTKTPAKGSNFRVAPYVDVSLTTLPDPQTLRSQGATEVVLAFANAAPSSTNPWNCTPSFAGYAYNDPHITNYVQQIKAAGLPIAVSFGGAAGGNDNNLTDLAYRCNPGTDPKNNNLTQAYQTAIDAVGAYRADFDVEGDQIVNAYTAQQGQGSFWNRNTAIHQLHANNPNLNISYTVTVGPNGPTDGGAGNVAAHLQALAGAGMGSAIGVWNFMTMDYYTAPAQGQTVGQMINTSWEGSTQFLASTLGVSEAQAAAASMATPMIGVNDDQINTVQPADLTAISANLRSSNAAGISFWSENRDNPCATGTVSPTCSGVGATAGAFLAAAANA